MQLRAVLQLLSALVLLAVGAAHYEWQRKIRSNYGGALCDGDGGGSLGLRLCLCTSPYERLAPPGAWHDVSAWHSPCAGRAHGNSPGRDGTCNAGRESDHIRRGALDRRAMRWRLVGACCHGKSDDGSIYRDGKSDDGSVCRDGRFDDRRVRRHGKLGARTVQHRALRRGRHERNRADDLCRVCDGISTLGLVHGSRVNRGPDWNSTRFDRNGRRRPQSSVRRSEPESFSARDELAAATQRHDAALDSVGGGGAEHTHMRGDPDRCPYDRGSADDVRSAFGRQSPGRGGDALPLINLEKRDVRLLLWAALSGTNPNHDRGVRVFIDGPEGP